MTKYFFRPLFQTNDIDDMEIWDEKSHIIPVGDTEFVIRALSFDEFNKFANEFMLLLSKYSDFGNIPFLDKKEEWKDKNKLETFANSLTNLYTNKKLSDDTIEMCARYFAPKKLVAKRKLFHSTYVFKKLLFKIINRMRYKRFIDCVRDTITVSGLQQVFLTAYQIHIDGVKKNSIFLLECLTLGQSPYFSVIFGESAAGMKKLSELKASANSY